MLKVFGLVLSLMLPLAAQSAGTGTVFNLKSVNIGNGWVISGTVTTDGTVGYLAPANFKKWNVTATQTTDTVFTKTSTTANISQLTSDGKKLTLPTGDLANGIDGGYLSFDNGSVYSYSAAYVADFSTNAVNINDQPMTGWVSPIGGLNVTTLVQPSVTDYTAAVVVNSKANVFNIR